MTFASLFVRVSRLPPLLFDCIRHPYYLKNQPSLEALLCVSMFVAMCVSFSSMKLLKMTVDRRIEHNKEEKYIKKKTFGRCLPSLRKVLAICRLFVISPIISFLENCKSEKRKKKEKKKSNVGLFCFFRTYFTSNLKLIYHVMINSGTSTLSIGV